MRDCPRIGRVAKFYSCVFLGSFLMGLQSWWPSKEVPKPWPGKAPKKVLRKVPVRNGVPRKVPKKVLLGPGGPERLL